MRVGVREALLGPSYFYHRDLIERSKRWSPAEMRQYQEARLRPLLERYGDSVRQKDDYRRDLGRFTRWDAPLLTHVVRTGGTSGQPLAFKADTFARRQKERAYLFDIWSQIGYAPYDLRVCYRGEIHGGLVRYDRLNNAWLISPGAAVEQELSTLRRWLRTLPPFFLHVHASSLFTFIDLVGERFFRNLPVRGVIAGSEAFPPAQQERFEEEFGIEVAHWYGHSEYAVLAYHCRACREFHFYPTYGYVELLPSATEDCRRIIATSFNRIGTQFVRYDTGDLAARAAGGCTANNFLRAASVAGRSQETFIDSAGRRRSLFGYVFGDEKSVLWDMLRDLQVIQDRPGFLRFRLVANPGANTDLIEQIYEQRLLLIAKLEFEYAPMIERHPNGKRRYFVNAMQDDASDYR